MSTRAKVAGEDRQSVVMCCRVPARLEGVSVASGRGARTDCGSFEGWLRRAGVKIATFPKGIVRFHTGPHGPTPSHFFTCAGELTLRRAMRALSRNPWLRIASHPPSLSSSRRRAASATSHACNRSTFSSRPLICLMSSPISCKSSSAVPPREIRKRPVLA